MEQVRNKAEQDFVRVDRMKSPPDGYTVLAASPRTCLRSGSAAVAGPQGGRDQAGVKRRLRDCRAQSGCPSTPSAARALRRARSGIETPAIPFEIGGCLFAAAVADDLALRLLKGELSDASVALHSDRDRESRFGTFGAQFKISLIAANFTLRHNRQVAFPGHAFTPLYGIACRSNTKEISLAGRGVTELR
jgi:hypothetical protein